MMTLPEWRTALRNLEAVCPWPGPVPLTLDDDSEQDSARTRALLVGRDDDLDDLIRMVLSRSLVVLHGESGVGKSSLLNVGLQDALEKAGFTPVIFSLWSKIPEHELDTPEIIDAQLRGPTLPAGIDPKSPTQILEQLEDELGDRAVVILDQFEELIRYKPQRFASVFEWLVDLNRTSPLRIIISLRSEYVHQLRRLEERVRPFSMDQFELLPVTDLASIKQIITLGNEDGNQAIDQAATTMLVDAWAALGPTSRDRGLLLLHATLYALNAIVAGAGRTTINADDVETLAAAAASGDDADGHGSLFSAGLAQAIEWKLRRCEEACRSEAEDGLDRVLVHGTKSVVRNCATHLSSAGFKLEREQWDLGRETLRRELGILAPVTNGLRPSFLTDSETILRALVARDGSDGGDDFLSVGRAAVVADLPDEGSAGSWDAGWARRTDGALAALGVSPAPWDTDPLEATAGPMMGLARRDVLIEELRRLAFALQWLESATLVRVTTLGPHQRMVTLTHDGFSRSLERWAERGTESPASALTLLTAARGERFTWSRPEGAVWAEFDGAESPRHLINLRWANGRVEAVFRRVVFVNCDFRGTRFVGCRFEGVVFVNCLLDGVTFEECTIVGGVTPAPVLAQQDREQLNAQVREMPSFSVEVSTADVATLHRYREDPGTSKAKTLLSVTSGVAAVPWGDASASTIDWDEQRGGLTMYGGRLSSIMVQRCRFEQDGQVAFRHVAGSSLDIVEQTTGRFEIYDSTIRGLSATAPVGEAGADGSITLRAIECALADTWVGDGLRGTVSIEHSTVWQLMNAGDPDRLRVAIADSRYSGVVNVSDISADSIPMNDFTASGIRDRSELTLMSTRMAYRSTPARHELQMRNGAL